MFLVLPHYYGGESGEGSCELRECRSSTAGSLAERNSRLNGGGNRG